MNTDFVFSAFFHFADVDVKVITVASDETEGYQRFIRSAQYYNIDVKYSKKRKTFLPSSNSLRRNFKLKFTGDDIRIR